MKEKFAPRCGLQAEQIVAEKDPPPAVVEIEGKQAFHRLYPDTGQIVDGGSGGNENLAQSLLLHIA